MLYPIQNNFRNKLDISGIWDFQTDPDEIGENNGWYLGLPETRPLAVPGSWNEQYADLFNYFGLGWYSKCFHIPNDWSSERVFIRVGSANYFCTIYINGAKVGTHEGGHLPFCFDISDYLKWGGENLITISVDNHLIPTRVPPAGVGSSIASGNITEGYPSTTFDFFPYSGIHRPVVLYTVPKDHIEDITVVTDIQGIDGMVRVLAKTNSPQQRGRVIISGGEVVVEEELVFLNGMAATTLKVPSARFWSHKDPYLYSLTLLTNTDCYSMEIGIRTIDVKGKQLLLNGEPVQLKGFGRHEDFFASGRGLNLPLMIKDYQLMRWVGANSYRTTHYPYSEDEMRLADQEGFLIIDETPAVGLQFDHEENIEERLRVCLQQIDELVSRDKNHPSVILWSVANEPMPPGLIEQFSRDEANENPLAQAGKEFLTRLLQHIRALDPSRPATFVSVMGTPLDWQTECDLICMNRYWGWYFQGGELEKGFDTLDQELDQTWDALGKPIILTEFGADTQPGLHGHPSVMWTEEYQADFIRGYLEVAARKDFVVGAHVWNFADFAAVQSIYRVGGMNMKGVFTRSRQPKMAAHLLREYWKKPSDPQAEEAPSPYGSAMIEEKNHTRERYGSEADIGSVMRSFAQRLDGKHQGLSTTLKFDFHSEGVFRVIFENGRCQVVPGDGEAAATVKLKWRDARKLLSGKLNPIAAVMTGKIKTSGDIRAFMFLKDLIEGD
jgi:beta-glucuronidase